MKEAANIAAALCCVLHFCHSFQTYEKRLYWNKHFRKLKYKEVWLINQTFNDKKKKKVYIFVILR